MDDATVRETSPRGLSHPEAPRDAARRISDVRQWLGTNGAFLGTDSVQRRTFFYVYLFAIFVVGVVNAVNVITLWHAEPDRWPINAIIGEGSSWITYTAFFWILWLVYRIAPPTVRPRWLLLIHIPGDVAFALAHVAGFVALRKLAGFIAGGHYAYGPFLPNFAYELSKDSFGYVLFQATFAAVEFLLRQQQSKEPSVPSPTFDIRDGAKITRVRLDEVLAVSSAGNYVEFVMDDGRKLLLRSSLSSLEDELRSRGFVRTHRSWLINASRMTALTPEGSGDYSIELGAVTAPLSRRYPNALTKLRGV